MIIRIKQIRLKRSTSSREVRVIQRIGQDIEKQKILQRFVQQGKLFDLREEDSGHREMQSRRECTVLRRRIPRGCPLSHIPFPCPGMRPTCSRMARLPTEPIRCVRIGGIFIHKVAINKQAEVPLRRASATFIKIIDTANTNKGNTWRRERGTAWERLSTVRLINTKRDYYLLLTNLSPMNTGNSTHRYFNIYFPQYTLPMLSQIP